MIYIEKNYVQDILLRKSFFVRIERFVVLFLIFIEEVMQKVELMNGKNFYKIWKKVRYIRRIFFYRIEEKEGEGKIKERKKEVKK